MTSVMGSEEAKNRRIAALAETDCSLCWAASQQPDFFLFTTKSESKMIARNCYPIREELKAREYRFGKATRTWSKKLTTGNEREDELAWIGARGFNFRIGAR